MESAPVSYDTLLLNIATARPDVVSHLVMDRIVKSAAEHYISGISSFLISNSALLDELLINAVQEPERVHISALSDTMLVVGIVNGNKIIALHPTVDFTINAIKSLFPNGSGLRQFKIFSSTNSYAESIDPVHPYLVRFPNGISAQDYLALALTKLNYEVYKVVTNFKTSLR